MNHLYNPVENIINQGSLQAINQTIASLNQNPGQIDKDYACGSNIFYVLKRLITASLARDPQIKNNVFNALKLISSQVTHLHQINKSALHQFFINTTDLSDCKSKQQKNAYIQGKINVIRALQEYFIGSDKIVNHFVQIVNQQDNLQQELVQALYKLSGDKIKNLKLSLKDTNAKSLHDILLKKPISTQSINNLLLAAINLYPKESTTLKYLGSNLANIIDSPQQFFTSEYVHFTNTSQQETDDGDLKRLYYLLQIQKYFLQSVIIGPKNISKYLSTEMVLVWLEQLRVKNRHMRKVAAQISINFEQNGEFSFEVLKFLHEKKIYLQNISQNHPFAALYKNVDSVKFWTYLIELINNSTVQQDKQKILEEVQQQRLAKRQQYLSELEYLTRERKSDFTPDQIGQTLTLLIQSYQQSKKSQKLLNLIWSLFHELLNTNSQKKKSKKKIVLNLKGALILSKIKITSLQFQSEIVQTFTKLIKFLRIKIKNYKQNPQQDKLMVAFINFVTGLIIYCIVYPEEADVCGQIEFIFKDLQSLIAKQKGLDVNTQKGKKKGKKQGQQTEDIKKPIHVLVDIFISLLTKAPIFLRNTINLVFEQMVPYIETSDLDTLLDVIQKPDQQYIQQI